MKIVFSHRPVIGVSAGACSHEGKLYFALALTNTGITLNGGYDYDKHDDFSRKMARQIITGRIAALINGKEFVHGAVFDNDMTAQEFMVQYRQVFKPEQDESDPTFRDKLELMDLVAEYRMSPVAIAEKAMLLAQEVLSGVTS